MIYQTELLSDILICVCLPDQTWGILKEDSFHEFNNPSSYALILSLLEKSYADVSLEVERINKELNLKPDNFPYIPLITTALTFPTSSAYWPSLAIAWLKDGAPINQSVSDLLMVIENDKKYDQKLRHTIKKVRNLRS